MSLLSLPAAAGQVPKANVLLVMADDLRDYRPILEKRSASINAAAFSLVTGGPKAYGRSVRTDRWRFTRWSDGQTEL